MTALSFLPDSDPRQKIKRIARKLFAERGLRDVTVREIAQAAGQRNQGVVAYYFGTKEKLVAEILIDGAKLIEERRRDYLDAMESGGGPKTVLEAVRAIVLPSAELSERSGEDGDDFNGFLLQVSFGSPGFIDRTLEGRWNTGYQRCLQHLRRLMPEMPLADKNRRFIFLGSYVGALLAQREAMLADRSRAHLTWHAGTTLKDIVQTAAALLEAPLAPAEPTAAD